MWPPSYHLISNLNLHAREPLFHLHPIIFFSQQKNF